MKRFVILSLFAFTACIFILFAPFADAHVVSPTFTAVPETTAPVTPPANSAPTAPSVSFDSRLTLRVYDDGAILSLCLQDYLLGVLPAEMPSSFPMEALKAQAVAARTFSLKQAQAHKHLGADVCTDSACCQGWHNPDTLSAEERERLLQAITQTDGLVAAYHNELIDATFFSCSGGKTEAAVAVWGGDVPYLQSVESPNEDDAPYFSDTNCYSAATFSAIFSAAYPQADLSGTPQAWFSNISYTDGGGIETVLIGGVEVRGTEVRKLFQLRSTAVEISVTEDEICFTSRGFGHRVGMSQYGAKAMAEAGDDFNEILLHYYKGTELRRLYLDGTDAV